MIQDFAEPGARGRHAGCARLTESELMALHHAGRMAAAEIARN